MCSCFSGLDCKPSPTQCQTKNQLLNKKIKIWKKQKKKMKMCEITKLPSRNKFESVDGQYPKLVKHNELLRIVYRVYLAFTH